MQKLKRQLCRSLEGFITVLETRSGSEIEEGSALAQAYNHIILPLANHRDKVTQVRWGIRDFQNRFGRKPEGLWLPETAVDLDSLDILAEEGISFTILAPHQARRIRRVGEAHWQSFGWQPSTRLAVVI